MMCTVMQPTFLPWLGYFDLIDSVDFFIFLDNVQIVKKTSNTWDCRNRIKTSQGELFLSFPIKNRHNINETLFNNSEIDDSRNWRTKHLKTIEMNYKKSKHFIQVFDFIHPLIQNDIKIVSDFNISIIKSIASMIGLQTTFLTASELNDIVGEKDNRLISICNTIDADSYLSPKGASQYIEKVNKGGAFASTSIDLKYQNYVPYEYPQLFGDFISHLSIIDLLFNVGFDNSLEIIRKGRKQSLKSNEISI